MTGQAHWFPLIVLFVAISPVVVFFLYERWANKRYLVEEATVRCRAHDNALLKVTLVRDRKTGQPVGVRRCNAFHPDDIVRCNKKCLPQFVHLKTAAA
jgi:hypothetical protein